MRRHRKEREEAELNVTSFMNLMIVLVPVLLLNMVFSQLAVIDLKLPGQDQPLEEINPEDVTLEVNIQDSGLSVTRVYQQQSEELASIPAVNNEHNYTELSRVLQDIKKNPIFADKTDINLLSSPDMDYQTIIRVMDTVRVFPAVVAASSVDAVLFPDISLGDLEVAE